MCSRFYEASKRKNLEAISFANTFGRECISAVHELRPVPIDRKSAADGLIPGLKRGSSEVCFVSWEIAMAMMPLSP